MQVYKLPAGRHARPGCTPVFGRSSRRTDGTECRAARTPLNTICTSRVPTVA